MSEMGDMGTPGLPHQTTTEWAFDLFQRAVAIFCMIAGIQYWALLIGLSDHGAWRFDLLPIHWKISAASLAVLWPVAGIGLWMLVSWGPVVWLFAALTEFFMYAIFSELYGGRWLLVLTHVSVLLLYGAFRAVLYFTRNADETEE
ncbi:MAG: DUF6163 family protein [Rhizobiaceae bacterium]|nr:DUF6163 family protein [Rhizobiaceae bacterium]